MKLVCSKNLYNNIDDSMIEYRKYKLSAVEKRRSVNRGYNFITKETKYSRNMSTGCYVLNGLINTTRS